MDHADALRQTGRGGIPGVHLGGNPMQEVMIEREGEKRLHRLGRQPLPTGGGIQGSADLCFVMVPIREPDRRVADECPLEFDRQRQRLLRSEEIGSLQPLFDLDFRVCMAPGLL